MKPKITYIFYLLGLGFIFFGTQKFGAENVVFAIIAERSGFDVFEPVIRRLTCVAEVLTGLALFLPRAQKLATLSSFAILLGAIGFHLSPWLGINVPGIGHGLFVTAVIMTTVSVYLISQIWALTLKPINLKEAKI